ncbi:MAG: hypothetical protein D6785_12390 [Planctomycetota bacterium]|nr:MAG: hypothetical protein D6785_12390 [Planctomycetota bacterium]
MAACPYGARHFNWGEPTHKPFMQFLFKFPLPSKKEIEEDEGLNYCLDLDKGKITDRLLVELMKEKIMVSRKAKVHIQTKGKQWILEEGRNKYLLHKDEKENSLRVSEVFDSLNPHTHYLGNRPRPKGVVEKCTFCIQRVRNGRYPACLEACPVGARKFGNLLDPNSEIRQALEKYRVFVLKEELNTKPSFFYFFS